MKESNPTINLKYLMLGAVLLLAILILPGCSSKAEMPDDYEYEDYSQYIKLAEYKGVEYQKADDQVSDEELQDYIDDALQNSATTTQNKTGKVKKDSVVNIDYTGSIDGVEFDGGAATDVELDIANSGYIDGFAEAIVGHKAGETFDINVTFPEDYGSEDLAGKDAVFKITVNHIIEKELPEYNDEWVKNNSNYSTIKEYEEAAKAEILASKSSSSDANERMDVFSQILEGTEVVQYPEKELNAVLTKLTDTYKEYAEANNMEFSKYLEDQMGIDEDQFNDLADKAAKDTVKQNLILHAIAAAEGIEITQDEYNEYLLKLLEDAGYTEDTFKEEKGITIQEYAIQNELFTAYLYQRVMDKVMEYSIEK